MPALRIFVSHSHADDAFGLRLIADLRRDLGSDDAVWYDVSGGLHGGDAWWRTIVREITTRAVFLVVLSPDAMASKWVEDEIDLAWQQKNAAAGKTIIPILYRECAVRADLTTRQIISFAAPSAYETAYGELLRALGVPGMPQVPGGPAPAAVSQARTALPQGTSRVIWCMEPDRAFGHQFVGALCSADDRAILRVYGDRDEAEELALARALAKDYAAQPDRCPGVVVVLSYGAMLESGFGELLAALDGDTRGGVAEMSDWPMFVTADAEIAHDFSAVALPMWPVYDLGTNYPTEFERFTEDAGVR